MKYKILIKKCEDPTIATRIAEEIARVSGTTADVVYNAVTQKPVCIRKEADEEEASRVRSQFSALGAEVELVELKATTVAQSPANRPSSDNDDDEEDEPGRVLTDEEYAQRLRERADIFAVEKDKRLRNVELIVLLLAIGLGLWMSTMEIVHVATDFFERLPEERTARLITDEIDASIDEEEKKEEEVPQERKKLTEDRSTGSGGSTGGGGDPRARATATGVLGIISGQITGKSVASADMFGEGGFASGIDAVLSGVGGLKTGGSSGAGRRGVSGIGSGTGYGSGHGGGGGGIDDLLGSLMSGGGGNLDLKKRGELKVTAPDLTKGGALTGGRSRASIQRVVMQNMAALRHIYNRRLREVPGLGGRVTVKFAIDEFGKVIFAEVTESTTGDNEFNNQVIGRIRRWNFDRIDKPGDVTEVVFPFVFSQ